MRIGKIFSSILEKGGSLNVAKEQAKVRKLSIYALCLIILTPVEKLQKGLPAELAKEVVYFKDEVESNNPFGGKIQMNPIPEVVKRMILKDSSVIVRLRKDGYSLGVDQRIWTYPKFKASLLATFKDSG